MSSKTLTSERDDSDAPCGDALRADLEERGVEPSFSRALARRLLDELGDDARDAAALEAAVAGAAAAFQLQDDVARAHTRASSETREVERLLGGFSEELAKLDETLEVLAAYVRRMRSATPEKKRPIVH